MRSNTAGLQEETLPSYNFSAFRGVLGDETAETVSWNEDANLLNLNLQFPIYLECALG